MFNGILFHFAFTLFAANLSENLSEFSQLFNLKNIKIEL